MDGIRNYVIYDIKAQDIEIVELRIPGPLSPIFAFGYNAYCKPFCIWEAEQAVKAGAELRTCTTVTDVIKEDGHIKGVVTDRGEQDKIEDCDKLRGIAGFTGDKGRGKG